MYYTLAKRCYNKSMQKGIDYIGVGIGAIIVNNEGKFFLSKRGKKARNERGLWEFPGGGLEFGESFENTIHRELMEEFGITVEIIRQISTFNHLIPDEKQHWVAVAFLCKHKSGTPKILEPEKCDEIGWFTFEEIKKLPLSTASDFRLVQIK